MKRHSCPDLSEEADEPNYTGSAILAQRGLSKSVQVLCNGIEAVCGTDFENSEAASLVISLHEFPTQA